MMEGITDKVEPVNLSEVAAEIYAEEIEQERKDAELLGKVKSKVSEEIYKEIEFEINESGFVHDYKILDEPIGELQEDPERTLRVYVDQSCGYFGDDYHGTVCVSLPCGKYLLWSFNM